MKKILAEYYLHYDEINGRFNEEEKKWPLAEFAPVVVHADAGRGVLHAAHDVVDVGHIVRAADHHGGVGLSASLSSPPPPPPRFALVLPRLLMYLFFSPLPLLLLLLLLLLLGCWQSMTRWLRLQENESVATLHVFLVTAATGVVHKVILNSRLNILVWRRSRMVFTLCEFNSMSLRMESRYKIGIFLWTISFI